MEEPRNDKDFKMNLAEFLSVFSKHKRMIVIATGATVIASVIISLLLPPIYRAETKILPPQQRDSGLAYQLMGQGGGLSALAFGSLGMKKPGDLYVGMLKSRTVFDAIIDRFGLIKAYDVKYREEARNRLGSALTARSGKDSIITVHVEDRDPRRAADMANAFVEELKTLNRGLALTEAAQRRLFFEEQILEVKSALLKSEEGIKGFQEKTGALKIDEQAKVVIAGIANVRAQISAREVQQRVMRTYATSQNPDIQRVEEEISGLKAELNKLEEKGGKGHDVLMPTGRMPSVGIEYLRKLREVKYNETLFELLAKQYELAKIDEARDAAVIQVIDKAVTPEKKVKPMRLLIVTVSLLCGFFLSVLAAFLIEYARSFSGTGAAQGDSNPS
jgi:tyrosine-protein kinase Etk/Wzc